MLAAALESILRDLPDDAHVLDVGGWSAPFNRADYVLDAQPFATRGTRGHHGRAWERFGAKTWIQRDACAREPWPFPDGRFDVVVCVMTLQLLRDPVWVCSEMSRVARGGYVEMPTVEAELLESDDVVGRSEHRWLCDLEGGELVFTAKPGAVHHDRGLRVPARFAETLTPEDLALGLFWEDRIPARERLLAGPEQEAYQDDLRRRLERRFPVAGTELRVKQARDAAQVGWEFARGPGRAAAGRLWEELRRRS